MKSLRSMVLAALFAGLTAAGALITIPFPQVPMVIANAFPWLAGLVLGPLWAAVSAGLYLLLGIFGLPVFAKGAAGVGVILGPTGGFLIGYVVSAGLVGLLRGSRPTNVGQNALAVSIGLVSVYALGIPWLAFVALGGPSGWQPPQLWKAAVWATSPAGIPLLFVVGDILKATAVIAVSRFLPRR